MEMGFSKLADAAFSIEKAASEFPNATAIVDCDRAISFSELRDLVRQRRQVLTRPQPGRPYILTGENTLDVFVTLYTLLEEKIPFLLLHPTLTQYEKTALLDQINAISSPIPENIAAILLTSGTTGKPKPAMLSRAALAASAFSNARNIVLTPNDTWLMSISVSRIGGLSILTRSLAARSRIVLFPHFCAENFIRALTEKHITLASIVPTMLSKLIEEFPNWKPDPGLRAILLGGSSASPLLLDKASMQGIPLVMTYGMTETASNIASSSYMERLKPKAAVRTNAFVELKTENETIRVRGPMVMSGYWGQKPLEPNAWFDTGDIGKINDFGEITVYARRTDLIVSGGENVYPAEVEKALVQIPGIKDALVLGMPDETWGKIVTALLVADKEPLTDKALKRALNQTLSSYKRPRRIAWVEKLPTNNSGKLNRNPDVVRRLSLRILHYKSA